MSALAVAAEHVQNAWCKGNMRKEEQSRAQGDTYCAAGALASALLEPGQLLTLDGEQFGPRDVVLELDMFAFKDAEETQEDWDRVKALKRQLEGYVSQLIDEDPRSQMLARVMMEHRPDIWVGWTAEDFEYSIENDAVDVIVQFNDDDNTTREQVVAAMLEADRRYEESQ